MLGIASLLSSPLQVGPIRIPQPTCIADGLPYMLIPSKELGVLLTARIVPPPPI